MGARVQNQDPAAHAGAPCNFLFEKRYCQFVSGRIDGVAEVDDVGGVYDKLFYAGLFHQCFCLRNFKLGEFFSSGILGGSGINHKGIGLIGQGLFDGA